MKIALVLLLSVFLLTGCGAAETFETVNDSIPVLPVAAPRWLEAQLPENAAAEAIWEDSQTRLYLTQDCTILMQTLPGGDLDRTMQQVTGKRTEELASITTSREGIVRHDFVWTAAGEEGLNLGRGCLLDDGDYHYVLTALSSESAVGTMGPAWEEMFTTCRLLEPGVDPNTGS